MMYFLVSRPPKTFIMASPAFSGISVKFAIAAGGGTGGCVWARVKHAEIRDAAVIQRRKRYPAFKDLGKMIFNAGLLVGTALRLRIIVRTDEDGSKTMSSPRQEEAFGSSECVGLRRRK